MGLLERFKGGVIVQELAVEGDFLRLYPQTREHYHQGQQRAQKAFHGITSLNICSVFQRANGRARHRPCRARQERTGVNRGSMRFPASRDRG